MSAPIAERYRELEREAAAIVEAPASRWHELVLARNRLLVEMRDAHGRLHSVKKDPRGPSLPEFHRSTLAPVARADAGVRRALLARPERVASIEARWRRLPELLRWTDRLHDDRNVALGIEHADLDASTKKIRAAIPAGKRPNPVAAEALDHAFDAILGLRRRWASNLGLPDAVASTYAAREVTRAELDSFRAALERWFVPVLRDLRARQARELGLRDVVPAEHGGNFPAWAIERRARPKRMVAWLKKTLGALHPALGGHLDRLIETDGLDLDAHPDKGGYGWWIAGTGIQANLGDDPTGMLTIFHELGHAFQHFESERHELLELCDPPATLMEIPSTAFELLALPCLARSLRPRELASLRAYAVALLVLQLAQAAAIDGFEHEVHERDVPIAERPAAYARWCKRFHPAVDWSRHEDWLCDQWRHDRIIFEMPFYWIGYAVAGVAALELSDVARRDRVEAIDRYLALCRAGNTAGVRGMISAAGLANPFDERSVARAAAIARRELGLAP